MLLPAAPAAAAAPTFTELIVAERVAVVAAAAVPVAMAVAGTLLAVLAVFRPVAANILLKPGLTVAAVALGGISNGMQQIAHVGSYASMKVRDGAG